MPHTAPIPAPPDTADAAMVATIPPRALPPGTSLSGRVDAFEGWSGTRLRYRVIDAAPERARLVYVHGVESHGAWFLPVAAELRRRGCSVWLPDRRGSGLNREIRPGDAPSARALIEDLHRFRCTLGDGPVHLAGLSWGGKLAAAAALEHPRDWATLTLIAPGLRARVDLPVRDKLTVALSLVRGGHARVPTPIRPEMFTATPPYLDFIRHDPWRTRAVTARFCLASLVLDRRLGRRGARLAMPVALILGGHDRIIDNVAVVAAVRRLRPDARVAVFAGAPHAVQFDCAARVVDQVARMVLGDARVNGSPR